MRIHLPSIAFPFPPGLHYCLPRVLLSPKLYFLPATFPNSSFQSPLPRNKQALVLSLTPDCASNRLPFSFRFEQRFAKRTHFDDSAWLPFHNGFSFYDAGFHCQWNLFLSSLSCSFPPKFRAAFSCPGRVQGRSPLFE